jgi:GT2 family glycosyltransferase
MSIGICIPTKNRSSNLAVLFTYLTRLKCSISRIVIVDSSDLPVQKQLNLEICNSIKFKTEYIWTSKSSTSFQRNLGINLLLEDPQTEYVFFLDDDTYPDSNHIEQLLGTMNFLGESYIGGSGIASNHVYKQSSFSLWVKKICLFSSSSPGKILASGHCSPAFDGDSLHPREVSWLWSCSLWRKDSIGSSRFKELYPGYVLGEDVLFSQDMNKKGKLFCDPNATLLHETKVGSQLINANYIEKRLLLRLEIIKNKENQFLAKLSFLWCNLFEQIYFSSLLIFSKASNYDYNVFFLLKTYFRFNVSCLLGRIPELKF